MKLCRNIVSQIRSTENQLVFIFQFNLGKILAKNIEYRDYRCRCYRVISFRKRIGIDGNRF